MSTTNIEKRPVIFFDLETTGKDKNTNNIRIVELSAIKYEDTIHWKEIGRLETRFNNGDVPIQKGAIEVHKIHPEDVCNLQTFQERAQEVFDFFNGCDVGGYNNSFFDNSVLYYSFKRAGIIWNWRNLKVYDILELYKKYHSNKLTHVYKLFTGKDLDNAHNASADIEATVEVYKKMKEINEDFENDELYHYKYNLDLQGVFKWRLNNKGEKEPYYSRGRHENKSVEEVGLGMLDWMLKQNYENYPLDTVQTIKYLQKWLGTKIDNNLRKREEDERKSGKKWYE